MSLETRYSDYDRMDIWFTHKGRERYEQFLTHLEELILQYLPKEAHIFDLCCGRGQIAQLLLEKGYRVTGLDGSELMLRYAREKASGANFILDDARYFKLSPTFDAAISIDVSLNHIMSIEELERVFQNVYAALLENGTFLFELSSEEDCLSQWGVPIIKNDVKDDSAWIEHSTYDREKKVVRENCTQFQLVNGQWQRLDVTSLRKAYSPTEVKSALEKVGFTEVKIYDEERDLGVSGRAGVACFICQKPLK
ncbi:MAG: methyltransferase domain-containing protein [Iphinoe sp. HA4291-MV1]|jgi:SAM-dependent methyltransferase|nr:methyltransferase domain-containing protein [Iphinoe sp. HA4291-MV1]